MMGGQTWTVAFASNKQLPKQQRLLLAPLLLSALFATHQPVDSDEISAVACEWANPTREPCFDEPYQIVIGGQSSPTACTDAVDNNAGVCAQSAFIRMYCRVTCGLCGARPLARC